MGLINRTTLVALDIGYYGSPFCDIGAKLDLSFTGLDWGFQGSSFVSVAPTAFIPDITLNIVATLDGISVNAQLELEAVSNLTIESTLEGIFANLQLSQSEFIRNLHITFSLGGRSREDMTVLFQAIRDYFFKVPIEFNVNRPHTYDFQNMKVLFETMTGGVLSDISIMFSIVRPPVSFVSYIFQKLYCTSSELFTNHGDVDIVDWNIKPNKTWYVKINNGTVSLYDTQSDMIGNVNLVASGIADSDLRVVLTATDEYDPLYYYYLDYPYHLGITELVSEDRFFKILPLTDMAEIRHPIYNNSNVAVSRGDAELDLHTHSEIKKEIVLGTHLPMLEVGDTVRHTSDRRNTTIISQVLSHTLSGTTEGEGKTVLINSFRTSTYLELERR